MRPEIEEVINTPGPVTLLKAETATSIDDIREILREAAKNAQLITCSHQNDRTEFCVRLSDNIDLVIESSTYLTNAKEYQDRFVSLALDAVENYEKHACVDKLDRNPMCAALLDSFFKEHKELETFEEAKRVRLKSNFDNACIWTPGEPRFRAAPEWTRIFTLLTIRKSAFNNSYVIALDPLELNELHPLDNVDPVARMWATARVELFKHEPEVSQ